MRVYKNKNIENEQLNFTINTVVVKSAVVYNSFCGVSSAARYNSYCGMSSAVVYNSYCVMSSAAVYN